MAAALSLIDVEALRQLWRISRMEFVFALIALWGAASFGVLNGVVIAIAATFAYLLHQMMYPHDALLGRVAGRDGFYKLHRTAEAEPIPGMTICLIQGSLLFFNADHVKARLIAIADGLPAGTRWLVLDASAIVQVDSTAAAMLEEVPRRPRRQRRRAGPGRVARRRARPARAGGPDRRDRPPDGFRGPRRRAARFRASEAST